MDNNNDPIQLPEGTTDTPEFKNTLEKALQENFDHARHQELQREKHMSFYWFLWAGALTYVGHNGDFNARLPLNWHIFFLLAIISLVTLIINLKWNAEFANHIAAAAAIARRLGLNHSTYEQKRTSNDPLPYPEFRGYMALPLKFSKFQNVGALFTVIHSIGLALSVYFGVLGLLTVCHCNCKRCILISCGCAILTFIGGLGIAYWMYRQMQRGLKTRTPVTDSGKLILLDERSLLSSWQTEFKRRMQRFSEVRQAVPGETAVSIKVRVESGCFHREHSPHAYALMDRHLDMLAVEDVHSFSFEERESGPEILVWLALTTAGVALAKSVIDLVTTIVKARSDGIKKGDRPAEPLVLIVRRMGNSDVCHEEKILRIGHTESVDTDKIDAALHHALEELMREDETKGS